MTMTIAIDPTPDSKPERRAALARELQWLAAMLPLGTSNDNFARVDDDRVAAIVATALLGLPSKAVDEAITRALAAVGLQRDVDRAFYYQLDDKAGVLTLTHEWHAPELRAMKAAPKFAHLRLDLLPAPLVANLRRGGVVRIPRTHKFLSPSVEQLVDADGDRALALLPVVVEGVLIGVAGFAAAVESAWQQGDIDLLQIVAQGVARAVERARVESALHASEERFRAMCDASPLGIFLTDESGDCLYLNPAGQRIAGRSQEEALGQGWINALHPDDRARVLPAWTTAVETRRAYARPVHRFLHRNGDVRSVEVRAVPIAGPGRQTGFLGLLEDVTDRVRAEQERQDMLARTEAARAEAEAARQEAEAARADVDNILSRISDAFIALDGDGRYTYANDRALTICGLPRDQLIGKSAWEHTPAAGRRPDFTVRFCRPSPSSAAVTVEAPFGPQAVRGAPVPVAHGRVVLLRGRLRSQAARRAADERSRVPAAGARRQGRRVGDRRQLTRAAADDGAGRDGRDHEHQRPHHGRDRHRQGAGRARDPRIAARAAIGRS